MDDIKKELVKILEKSLSKILSGKWIVTVAGAAVFLKTALSGTLPSNDVKMILAIIVTFYFTKKQVSEKE